MRNTKKSATLVRKHHFLCVDVENERVSVNQVEIFRTGKKSKEQIDNKISNTKGFPIHGIFLKCTRKKPINNRN